MSFLIARQAEEVDEQMRAALGAARNSGARGSGLLLIASLLGKAPNLAGLARTCEVLG